MWCTSFCATEHSRSTEEATRTQKAIQKDTWLPQCWVYHCLWSPGRTLHAEVFNTYSMHMDTVDPFNKDTVTWPHTCIYDQFITDTIALCMCSILWKWRIKTSTKYHLIGHESVGMSVRMNFIFSHLNLSFYWHRTKQVTRFHPPYVLEDVQLLAQHSDQLVINAKQAWNEFLRYVCICTIWYDWGIIAIATKCSLPWHISDFSIQYGACKKAVDLLATLDCLVSLAEVAVMPGYVW